MKIWHKACPAEDRVVTTLNTDIIDMINKIVKRFVKSCYINYNIICFYNLSQQLAFNLVKYVYTIAIEKRESL